MVGGLNIRTSTILFVCFLLKIPFVVNANPPTTEPAGKIQPVKTTVTSSDIDNNPARHVRASFVSDNEHQITNQHVAKNARSPISMTTYGETLGRAEGGDSDAMFKIGRMFFEGHGDITRDRSKALKWIMKSAESGNHKAMFRLAQIYYYGQGSIVDKNIAQAVEWCHKAAEAGDAFAMYTLAKLYLMEKEESVTRDQEKGEQWLTKAHKVLNESAEDGDPEALYMLGEINWQYPPLSPKYAEKAAQWHRMAAECYEKQAEAGDYEAMYKLGTMYKWGKGVNQDFVKSAYWYQKAAGAGDPRGMAELAECYRYGCGVPKNLSKAFEWYLKAVRIRPDATTMLSIAELYQKGEGSSEDISSVVEILNDSAEADFEGIFDLAAFSFAEIYQQGKHLPQDTIAAEKLYQQAAELGHGQAMVKVGKYYYYGNIVEQNYTKAFEWFSKAAHWRVYPKSRLYLALLYHKGQGINKNDVKAIDWLLSIDKESTSDSLNDLSKDLIKDGIPSNEVIDLYCLAAENRCSNFMNALGQIYTEGEVVAKDLLKAMVWYSKAAEAGNSGGMINLGWDYYKLEDFENAFKWFQKAANLGELDALRMVGVLYSNGQGVHRDKSEAIKWWSKAAEAGNSAAMWCLGYAYENGQGVIQDYNEAFRWYTKGAEAGHIASIYSLGLMYGQGRGVTINNFKAVEWWRKGAEKEDVLCMANLGWAYLYGKGIQQDRQQAVRWLQKAAELGNEFARNLLAQMNQIR